MWPGDGKAVINMLVREARDMTQSLIDAGWDGVSGLGEICGSSTTAHTACRPTPMVRPVRPHIMDGGDDGRDDVDDWDDDEDDDDEDDDDEDDDDEDDDDEDDDDELDDDDDHTS